MTNKFDYVISHFCRIFGLVPGEVEIGYGDDAAKINIRRGRVAYFETRQKLALDAVVHKQWDGVTIPFLLDTADAEILEIRDGRAEINFDIIASSFFMLSGWQEYACDVRDEHGRFPFAESLQSRFNLVEVPVVNYYFDILKTAVETVYNRKLAPAPWGDHSFVTCLTHDIDKCRTGWLEGGAQGLRRWRPWPLLRFGLQALFAKDDWFNFETMLDIERRFQAHASYYFLCRKGKARDETTSDYDIEDPKFRRVFELIQQQGSEIGVHGSYGAHASIEQLVQDIIRLNHSAHGNRFHYLMYDVRSTPRLLHEAGFKYDSTLGFSEHFGFRNGICFPFYLYDIENDRPLDVLEIPLHLMDGTLQNPAYMGVPQSEVLERTAGMIQEVRKFGGCFTILWHNTHYSECKYAGWRDVLLELMEYCQAQGSPFFSGKEIFELYTRA